MERNIVFLLFLFKFCLLSGQFAPVVGEEGSTAISKDSSLIINWASKGIVQRGYVDISDKSKGNVIQGSIEKSYGKADNVTVSLGDSGVVVLEFNPPIVNGESWDFAVFENSFDDTFLELATVEVSSDGERFVMFPPVSLTKYDTQVGSFGLLDATKIHNLAGKYRGGYGTPFDLDSLPESDFLDKDNIVYVRVTDVVGSINPLYSREDSFGHPINDPFPTPFESGGFDLDAVGVIHEKVPNSNLNLSLKSIIVYPSPVMDVLNIKTTYNVKSQLHILDINGHYMMSSTITNKCLVDVSDFPDGIYYVVIYNDDKAAELASFIKI